MVYDFTPTHYERVQARLHALLDEDVVDAHGERRHGLAWWYPQVKRWSTVRSAVSGSGHGGREAPMPMNADATDFATSRYWAGVDASGVDRPMPQPKSRVEEQDLADPANYRAGFEPTVLDLERAVRLRLGQARAPRLRSAADPLRPQPAVVAAITYLRHFIPEIAADEQLAERVQAEASRLVSRARGMMHGARWGAGRGPCPHCHQVDSVVSDEDRAFCDNPFCRQPDGDRHCWRWDLPTSEWRSVPEPDPRRRPQLSDDQLAHLAEQ